MYVNNDSLFLKTCFILFFVKICLSYFFTYFALKIKIENIYCFNKNNKEKEDETKKMICLLLFLIVFPFNSD